MVLSVRRSKNIRHKETKGTRSKSWECVNDCRPKPFILRGLAAIRLLALTLLRPRSSVTCRLSPNEFNCSQIMLQFGTVI